MKVMFGFVDDERSGRVWLKEDLAAQAFESANEVARGVRETYYCRETRRSEPSLRVTALFACCKLLLVVFADQVRRVEDLVVKTTLGPLANFNNRTLKR